MTGLPPDAPFPSFSGGELPSPLQDGPGFDADAGAGAGGGRFRRLWARTRRGWRETEEDRECCSDGCDNACCAVEGAECCLDGSPWLGLLAILWCALVSHPHDPHTAAPRSRPARAAWELVRAYQLQVSARRARPVCPMTPSCSRYALQALSGHGLARGGVLVVRRLHRCSGRRPAVDPCP